MWNWPASRVICGYDEGEVPNETLLRAAALWEKTSQQGRRYFVGRLGGVKLVIFEKRDRQSEDDPTHELFFAPAPERPRGDRGGQPRQASPRQQRPQPTRQPGQPRQYGPPEPGFDDELPF
jgi:hypothetical protein